MITAFFITGLYFLGFFLHRKKDKHLFFFHDVSSFSVIVLLIGRERMIFLFFPSVSFSALSVMRATTMVLVSIAVFLYLYFAYREIVSKKWIIGATAFSALVLLIDFISWGFTDRLAYVLHSVLAVTTLIYITYVFAIAALRK